MNQSEIIKKGRPTLPKDQAYKTLILNTYMFLLSTGSIKENGPAYKRLKNLARKWL